MLRFVFLYFSDIWLYNNYGDYLLKKFISIFFIPVCFFSLFINSSNTVSEYCFPCDTRIITSKYGYRDLLGSTNFHNGTDFGATRGSKIYAISSGTITHVGFLNGYGNSVIISHQNGYKSLYGHMDEAYNVSIGDYVPKGYLIGYVGPKYLSNGKLNGFTTGPHLHLTVFDKNSNTIDPTLLKFK